MSYLLEVEQHLIALLLAEGASIWADVNLLVDKDFSPTYQQVMGVIRQQLDQSPPASTTPVVIAEKLKSYAVTEINGFDTLVVLNGLYQRSRLVDKKDARALMIELKTATAKRDLIAACEVAKGKIKQASKLSEMVEAVTSTLTGVNTEYFAAGEVAKVFDGIIENVEERGNSPKDPSTLGYVGPLPSFNDTFGPDLIAPSLLTILTARTSNGKSAFSFFYCVSVAEQHGIPLLWADAGEMTIEQLQMRAVCCLSHGRVPLWAVKSGEWRKEPAWEKIIRQEVWPRVKKIDMYYQGTGGMTAIEKIRFFKRFYFNKIGRDNFLLISDDYLKGIEAMGKNSSEHQSMGYYLSDVKTLITEDIKASYWAGVQANRFGIHQGKKQDEVMDSEAVISMSDRISHNASTILLLRNKVTDELAAEKNMFGNALIKPLKHRELSARNAAKLLKPVKTPKGAFVPNYFNLQFDSFYYHDKGTYSDMIEKMGHGYIDLASDRDEKKMP